MKTMEEKAKEIAKLMEDGKGNDYFTESEPSILI